MNFVDSWGLDSYIFYGVDQKRAAEATCAQLRENDPETPVHMIYVDKASDFYEGWEGMGQDDNGNTVTIDNVIIELHGKIDALVVGSQSIKSADLSIKEIDTIFLTACNTGNMNAENFASQLAMTQSVNQVIAPDGYGHFYDPNTISSHYFADKEAGGVDRKGKGFVLYQNIDGKCIAIPNLVKDAEGVRMYELLSWGKTLGEAVRGFPKDSLGYNYVSKKFQYLLQGDI